MCSSTAGPSGLRLGMEGPGLLMSCSLPLGDNRKLGWGPFCFLMAAGSRRGVELLGNVSRWTLWPRGGSGPQAVTPWLLDQIQDADDLVWVPRNNT